MFFNDMTVAANKKYVTGTRYSVEEGGKVLPIIVMKVQSKNILILVKAQLLVQLVFQSMRNGR